MTPELKAGARTMWECDPQAFTVEGDRLVPLSFEDIDEETRAEWCQAFAAGLRALLPVSQAVVEAMVDEANKDGGGSYSGQFTAAIRHICGDDDATGGEG